MSRRFAALAAKAREISGALTVKKTEDLKKARRESSWEPEGDFIFVNVRWNRRVETEEIRG
jgi:hypothetical protein